MKGILLAGGSGTRLHPLTLAISKQLLPVYNKPMCYYPLSLLFLAGIKEICIITTPHDLPLFQRLLKDGSQFGAHFTYRTQEEPRGIAEALLIAEDFIGQESVALVLGDNIIYGNHLQPLLLGAKERHGATIFAYRVKNPSRYGVVEIDSRGEPLRIVEKPKEFISPLAVTGLYFYDEKAVEMAKTLKPSMRGELEISDLNQLYLDEKELTVEQLGRGITWLDMGTHESLLQANQYIQVVEERQGLFIGSLEEVAYRQGWISHKDLEAMASKMEGSGYGATLKELV